MNKLKYVMISFEGIDKTGKGTLVNYLKEVGNKKYVLLDRGIVSNIVYAKIFGRDYDYDLDSFRNVTFVHLVADDEDLKIRCKLTNEPTFNLERDKKAFKDQFDKMVKDGFDVMTINTSHFTPYKAAKLIVQHMEEKNS